MTRKYYLPARGINTMDIGKYFKVWYNRFSSLQFIGNIVISKIFISGFCLVHFTVTFATTRLLFVATENAVYDNRVLIITTGS